MKTLISADNTWALFAILVVVAALAIWMEQKYKWAGKVTGCVIALIGIGGSVGAIFRAAGRAVAVIAVISDPGVTAAFALTFAVTAAGAFPFPGTAAAGLGKLHQMRIYFPGNLPDR